MVLLLGLLSWLAVGVTPAPAAAAVSARPQWRLPLTGSAVVSRPFVAPAARWLPGHRGVDLLSWPGTQVLAASEGTVTFAAVLAGRPVVVVRHGGVRTTYEPVVASVRVGEHVHGGEPIGRLLAAGSHCAPAACLHWGALRGNVYLDPMSLLGAQRVRLLPWG